MRRHAFVGLLSLCSTSLVFGCGPTSGDDRPAPGGSSDSGQMGGLFDAGSDAGPSPDDPSEDGGGGGMFDDASGGGGGMFDDASGGDGGLPETSVERTISPDGGSIDLGGRVELDIPRGAVSGPKKLRVSVAERSPSSKVDPVDGRIYEFGPEGTTFEEPVTVRFEYDGSADRNVAIYWTDKNSDEFEALPTSIEDGEATAEVTHFSLGALVRIPSCQSDADCPGKVQCQNELCYKPNCQNQRLDGFETDTDCGGPVCSSCTEEETCRKGSDCRSGRCTSGTCATDAVRPDAGDGGTDGGQSDAGDAGMDAGDTGDQIDTGQPDAGDAGRDSGDTGDRRDTSQPDADDGGTVDTGQPDTGDVGMDTSDDTDTGSNPTDTGTADSGTDTSDARMSDADGGGGSCRTDADCSGSKVCVNGTCVRPMNLCRNDADCDPDEVCVSGVCTSSSSDTGTDGGSADTDTSDVDSGSGSCRTDADCPNGFCVNGQCFQ